MTPKLLDSFELEERCRLRTGRLRQYVPGWAMDPRWVIVQTLVAKLHKSAPKMSTIPMPFDGPAYTALS